MIAVTAVVLLVLGGAVEPDTAATAALTLVARNVPHDRAVLLSFRIDRGVFEEGETVRLTIRRQRGAAEAKEVFSDAIAAESATGEHTDRADIVPGAAYSYAATVRIGDRTFSADSGMVTVPTVFTWDRLKTFLALCIFGGFFYYLIRASRTRETFLRRIPGIDAIEEAIGRATEMGKPVLYIPGLKDQSDLQTLASLVVLGDVGRTTAEYGVRLLVPTRYPVVMTMAEEIVRDAYTVAGRPDAFVREDIRFLSDNQFAYCAGVDGIMLREEPAANLYMGAFYAESLILSETGYAGGAIQVAGTASPTQIPFFVVACDYTMIGEEFYAASAYLSRDPKAVAGIKAADWLKIVLIAYFLTGGALALAAAVIGPDKPSFVHTLLEYMKMPQRLFGIGN